MVIRSYDPGGRVRMKKILILTSTGGGGNYAVSNSLKEYLKTNYAVHELLPFQMILQSLRPACFFKNLSGEEIYNFLLQKKWYRLANLWFNMGDYFFKIISFYTKKFFKQYFLKEKPNLVISVVPIINNEIFCVTKQLNIPFLLIPTDLDGRVFYSRLSHINSHNNFKVALPFDDNEIIDMAHQYGIENAHIEITGFPLKPSFLMDRNKDQIRNHFNIPDDKQTLLLLMGKQGSHEMYRFAQQLGKIETPIHLICCIGKNEAVRPYVESIELPEHISISIIGFTEKIADLMAISDLIITKSGSVSFCETLYSSIPTILDATSTVLRWERFNHTFFKKHNLGGILTANSSITEQIQTLLNDKKLMSTFRNNLLTLEKNKASCKIPELIKTMLVPTTQTKENKCYQPKFKQLSIVQPVKQK